MGGVERRENHAGVCQPGAKKGGLTTRRNQALIILSAVRPSEHQLTPAVVQAGRVSQLGSGSMKYVLAIVAAASISGAVPASADEVGVGVGVAPGVGAGVTVGSDQRDRDRERERTTVIKEHEPRDTTVIKEREREPDRKVIIDHDRN
jgi:hypothetical protein